MGEKKAALKASFCFATSAKSRVFGGINNRDKTSENYELNQNYLAAKFPNKIALYKMFEIANFSLLRFN